MSDLNNLGKTATAWSVKAGNRVLVTGGTGFIGSHLVDALVREGIRPCVLVRDTSDTTRLRTQRVDVIKGSLGDLPSLKAAVSGAEVVYHVAAVTKAPRETTYMRANAEGTRNLIRAMLESSPSPRRLVYLSSLAAAGPSINGVPIGVDDKPHPITAYGRSKLLAEQVCQEAADSFEVVTLRAPVVYGPREKDFLLLFRLAARGLLLSPAGPERLIQLIHVSDLVKALVRAGTAPGVTGIYHVAESRSYCWTEVADCISRAVGRSVRTVRVPQVMVHVLAIFSELAALIRGKTTILNREKVKELLAPNWLCETGLAKRELGFEARIPIAAGFAETAAWYKQETWL